MATLQVRSSSLSQVRGSAQTVNLCTSRSAILSRRASARGSYFNNESNEYIRRRAYALYEQRGREDGHDIDDWLRAEVELTAQTMKAGA